MDTLIYIIQNMLPVAIPLMVVAIGGMFSERSGVVNIALEGIMLIGAYIAALFVLGMKGTGMNVHIIFLLAIIVAGISGIAFSMLLSFAAVNMKANQTITGTAMNLIVPAIILLFSKMKFNSDGVTTGVNLYITKVPLLGDIPIIGEMFFQNTYATIYIGFLILVVSTILIYKTRFGLRLRATGEHPQAVESVGVSVAKMRYFGVGISGLLGGIGGYFYSVGIMSSNVNGHTGVAGFGFLALAVLIFGQWKPIRILFASLFFAFLRVLAYSITLIPFLNDLNINQTYYKILPYLATLVLLIFTSKHSRAPKASGVPYDKGLR